MLSEEEQSIGDEDTLYIDEEIQFPDFLSLSENPFF